MNEVSIIINGVRYDAVEEEDLRSCRGCGLVGGVSTCCWPALCARHGIIFKKSTKSFEP